MKPEDVSQRSYRFENEKIYKAEVEESPRESRIPDMNNSLNLSQKNNMLLDNSKNTTQDTLQKVVPKREPSASKTLCPVCNIFSKTIVDDIACFKCLKRNVEYETNQTEQRS